MADLESVLDGLNPAQREAALALRGPVVILAGAGTGKTTTITHRIACQVRSGEFEPSQILAVTFTDKAAGRAPEPLEGLGVHHVEARTFHSAALSQLSRLWTRTPASRSPRSSTTRRPSSPRSRTRSRRPHKFLPRRELAGEIEWAKNRMIPPARYLAELGDHEPPIPADLMHRVYDGYERRKRSMGRLDFEDMLGLALRLFDEHPDAAEQVRSRFAAFTVDEYQDVNPLQAGLLERWLGDRDDLCVVGDDYQTIYAFTGARPSTSSASRPGTRTRPWCGSRRTTAPRPRCSSSPTGSRPPGGFRKTLRATRPRDRRRRARRARRGGRDRRRRRGRAAAPQEEAVPLEEIAVLYRINARSEPFEEAFAAAGIPYQVRDGAFLRRPGRVGAPAAEALRRRLVGRGRRGDHRPARLRPRGLTRRRRGGHAPVRPRPDALARDRVRARAPGGDAAAFGAELARRFSTEHSGRGVNLLTYHRAKGLEFDAVFLPRLLDGELPFRSGRAKADPEEERRLLYVGITRARRYLFLTWPTDGRARPSPFLDEMELASSAPSRQRAARGPAVSVGRGGAVFDRLKEWRRKRAQADGVPAYVVFHDRTLAEIAENQPRDWADLAAISGVGPAKLERYADEVLAVVAPG
jgi:DNA helicase-2/ATP-dependent DNA helicase PcrA